MPKLPSMMIKIDSDDDNGRHDAPSVLSLRLVAFAKSHGEDFKYK